MGMHEYTVGLSDARTSQDIKFVEQAFVAGIKSEQERILQLLGVESKYGYVNDLLASLRKKIEETGKY